MNQPSQRFTLILRTQEKGWRTPGFQRLRLALKALLRGYGLVAESVTEIAPEPKPNARMQALIEQEEKDSQ